jgi:general secretion pathway protein I
MNPVSRDPRGFTLLEVMIAIALLALSLPILLGLRNRDMVMIERARTLTTATLLAQEKLFETYLLGFPPIGEQRGEFTGPPPGYTVNPEAADRAPGFRWVRIVGPGLFEYVRDVKVRVLWDAGSGEDFVELTTYAFQEPPPKL